MVDRRLGHDNNPEDNRSTNRPRLDSSRHPARNQHLRFHRGRDNWGQGQQTEQGQPLAQEQVHPQLQRRNARRWMYREILGQPTNHPQPDVHHQTPHNTNVHFRDGQTRQQEQSNHSGLFNSEERLRLTEQQGRINPELQELDTQAKRLIQRWERHREGIEILAHQDLQQMGEQSRILQEKIDQQMRNAQIGISNIRMTEHLSKYMLNLGRISQQTQPEQRHSERPTNIPHFDSSRHSTHDRNLLFQRRDIQAQRQQREQREATSPELQQFGAQVQPLIDKWKKHTRRVERLSSQDLKNVCVGAQTAIKSLEQLARNKQHDSYSSEIISRYMKELVSINVNSVSAQEWLKKLNKDFQPFQNERDKLNEYYVGIMNEAENDLALQQVAYKMTAKYKELVIQQQAHPEYGRTVQYIDGMQRYKDELLSEGKTHEQIEPNLINRARHYQKSEAEQIAKARAKEIKVIAQAAITERPRLQQSEQSQQALQQRIRQRKPFIKEVKVKLIKTLKTIKKYWR